MKRLHLVAIEAIIFSIIATDALEVYAERPVAGYLVNAALVKRKRIRDAEREAQEDNEYEYGIGKIGGDKTFSVNSGEIQTGELPEQDYVKTASQDEKKKYLLSCVLDVVEQYPIMAFVENLCTVITEFYAPFAENGNPEEWKLEIRITGASDDLSLKVRAFSKKNGKIREDKAFASQIAKNILIRFNKRYDKSHVSVVDPASPIVTKVAQSKKSK